MDKKEHSSHHIVPLSVYYKVWAGLIIGTIVTVLSSYVDFGSWNILIAMLIATAKAMLVVLFFMGLKYDGYENNVTFFCTVVFLGIFVGLTSTDIFYRPEATPVHVDASEMPPSSTPVDLKAFAKATPEVLEKGKTLFGQQCIACHGAEGKADGPAAAALVPKPRNFTVDQGWKNGRTLTQVFKTLTEGLPGSAMASFSTLSVEDRLALAQYVRSLGANAPDDKPEALDALQAQLAGPAKMRLPVQRAIEKMAEEWDATHR